LCSGALSARGGAGGVAGAAAVPGGGTLDISLPG
jgi:hypothetical protein